MGLASGQEAGSASVHDRTRAAQGASPRGFGIVSIVDDVRTLGKYRILAKIGDGGMASVYLAIVRGPGDFRKLVVLKELRADLAEEPEHVAMFLDEARLAARLNHPNIAQTNEIGVDDGRHFIAMEFLDGQPLHRMRSRLAKGAPVPLAAELKIISDVLAGLHHAHELADYDGRPLGVVHRDVSPHNVIVTYDGRVALLDFGIAKSADTSRRTVTGAIKGKIAYMAPEQARGEPLDRRADLYAVGVMLWEAATGSRMWAGLEDIVVLSRVSEGRAPAPSAVNPAVPIGLETLCQKALAADREDRFPTALAMKQAVDALASELSCAMSSEALGKLLAAPFDVDRKRMNAIIEAGHRGTPEDAEGLRSAIGVTGGDLRAPASRTPPPMLAADGAVTGTMRRTRGATWVRIAAAAASAAIVAVGSTRWLSAPRALAPAPLAPSTSPAAPAMIALRIVAQPPSSRVFLDDAPLDASSFEGARPRDGKIHRIRAEAPGFRAVVRDIPFDADLRVELSLEPLAAPAQSSVEAPNDAVRARAPGSKKRVRRDIDGDNPYTH